MTTILPRLQLLGQLSDLILNIKRDHPTRVAIDGIDAAGKTSLADELAPIIRKGGRSVIRISIDAFHHPRHKRYQRGELSPEGYYYDSFDYQAIREDVLRPLGRSRNCRYKRAAFDFRSDTLITEPLHIAPHDAVLLMDGVFLMRPELLNHWDFRIFVMVENEVAVNRAIKRDRDLFTSQEEIIKRYKLRYIPGQELYLRTANPLSYADVLVNNNNPEEPEMKLMNK